MNMQFCVLALLYRSEDGKAFLRSKVKQLQELESIYDATPPQLLAALATFYERLANFEEAANCLKKALDNDSASKLIPINICALAWTTLISSS